MTRTNTLRFAIAAAGLIAASFLPTAAGASGISFSFGFGDGDTMLDSGVTVGDPMGYPLLADGPAVEFHGPMLPLGPQVDPRVEAQHAHDCRILKEIEAEIELIRAHWNKAFSKYAFGPTRDATLKMDEQALEKWTAMAKEYRIKCYGR